MKREFIVKLIYVLLFIGFLTSCTDIIDPSAANSRSAILAVLGEYLYATFTFIMVALFWFFRPAGLALMALGFLGLFNYVNLSINPTLMTFIGLLLFLASYVPIKHNEPIVIISKHYKIQKEKNVKPKNSSYQDYFLQLLIGLILLIVEYMVFAK